MGRYNVCESIVEALRLARAVQEGKRALVLNSSQQKAVEILLGSINGTGKAPLGGVQGPPGTGKTSVVEYFAYKHLADMIDTMNNELIIYVAPTNHLVAQAFERVSAALLAKGLGVRDVIDRVRVYGYRIGVHGCGEILERAVEEGIADRDEVPSAEVLKTVVHEGVDPNRVRIVFATEYQRVSGRFLSKPDRVHLIVDESSKSPFYRAFISIADHVMRHDDYISSLVVLGDPEQAITVPQAFREQRVSLLMERVKRLLELNSIDKDNFVMLDVTYRLPGPSEQPISYGFYDGKLWAHSLARQRMRELRNLFEDARSRVQSLFHKAPSEAQRVFDAIYSAVSSEVPLTVIETRPFKAYKSISTYDPWRTELGLYASLVLQAFAYEAMKGSYYVPQTMVIAPYSDVVTNVSFNFRRRYPSLPPPRSSTVQAVIGGEADAVVAVLGKEYSTSGRGFLWGSDGVDTMYFNEPPVLNVQLSRHYKFMVIIGSTAKLKEAHNPKLSKTMKKIHELVEGDNAVMVRME
ncbi:MAG: AAA family ATPase [Crenarchaeota archaeon]|nr:AAA family ATPase [Thermoproteota archaeon]